MGFWATIVMVVTFVAVVIDRVFNNKSKKV